MRDSKCQTRTRVSLKFLTRGQKPEDNRGLRRGLKAIPVVCGEARLA